MSVTRHDRLVKDGLPADELPEDRSVFFDSTRRLAALAVGLGIVAASGAVLVFYYLQSDGRSDRSDKSSKKRRVGRRLGYKRRSSVRSVLFTHLLQKSKSKFETSEKHSEPASPVPPASKLALPTLPLVETTPPAPPPTRAPPAAEPAPPLPPVIETASPAPSAEPAPAPPATEPAPSTPSPAP